MKNKFNESLIISFKEFLRIVKGYNQRTVSSRASNLIKIFKELAKVKGDMWNNIEITSKLYKFEEVSSAFESKQKFDSFFQTSFRIPENYSSSLSTYKKTWNLFLDYKENELLSLNELNNEELIKTNYKNIFSEIFNGVIQEILKFTNQSDVKEKVFRMLDPGFDGKKSQKIECIQEKLFEFLKKETKSYANDFSWHVEHVFPEENRKKDRIDIYGKLTQDNKELHIVIELDAHRADQVSKKYLSRQAIFKDKNLIYISLCYPGTSKMSKNECIKYFEYCKDITEILNETNKNTKFFAGVFFKSINNQ